MTQNRQSFDFFFNQLFTAVFSQNKMLCLCLTLKRDGAERGYIIRDTEAEVKIALKRRKKEEERAQQ